MVKIANIIRNEVEKNCRELKIFTALVGRIFVLFFYILFAIETGTWKRVHTQVQLAKVIDFSHTGVLNICLI